MEPRRPSAFGVSLVVGASMLLMAASVPRAASVDTPNRSDVADRHSAGRATFLQFCAACHGADGKGSGPAARFLHTAPADLTQIRLRQGGLFPHDALESVLLAPTRSSVTPAMPSQMLLWGPIFLSLDGDPVLAHTRVADLVAFIESLQEQ